MNLTTFLLLSFLIGCAIAVSLTRDLLSSVLILMGYSTVMSVIWLILESPDLAITEAAVGAGVTTILFFITFRRIGLIGGRKDKDSSTGMERKQTFRKLQKNETTEDGTK